MAGPLYYDRVLESSVTTGTGTYTLAGAVTGYQSFAAVGNANTAYYCAYEVDANGNASGGWEVGLGTYTSSGTTLARTSILASSNSGSAVSWSAGTRRIALVQPAPVISGFTSCVLLDGYITVTVGSSAMTVTIKNSAGNTPSAATPVRITFGGTAGAAPTTLTLTSATSFTVSSGSTLGTSNGTAFRVWFVGFNDAGTFRLGAINANTNGNEICQVRDGFVANSQAEGGAGGADSNAIFYTGTAVSNKQYRVLGYATWESGLATAGTWSAAPTNTVQYSPGSPLPGDVIRIDRTEYTAVATGTTTTPADDTRPLVTEGDQYMSHTPSWYSPANICRLRAMGAFASSVVNNMTMALYSSAISGNLKANDGVVAGVGYRIEILIDYSGLCHSTGETFTIRCGGNNAGTTTFNGTGGAGLFSGTYSSFIETQEVMG